jgi:hypothetical protein
MPSEKKSQRVSPKIQPIAGTLEYKRIKCGKANCKCAKGESHGEYAYLRVQENKKRFRRYVKKINLSKVIAGIEAQRKQKAQQQAKRRQSNELLRQLRQECRTINALVKSFFLSEGRR